MPLYFPIHFTEPAIIMAHSSPRTVGPLTWDEWATEYAFAKTQKIMQQMNTIHKEQSHQAMQQQNRLFTNLGIMMKETHKENAQRTHEDRGIMDSKAIHNLESFKGETKGGVEEVPQWRR